MASPPISLPINLYRCVNCGHDPLEIIGAQDGRQETITSSDRLYCPNCGETYSLLKCGAPDFVKSRPKLSPAQLVAHNIPFAWAYERVWRGNALPWLTGQSFTIGRETDLVEDWIGTADPVLDIAAASGLWSRSLLERDPERTIIALELSAPLVTEASQRTKPDWSNYSLVRGKAEDLPFADQTFAAVISGGSLNELPYQETLAEVTRVLKPEGIFVSMHIRAVDGLGQWAQQAIAPSGMQFYSEASIRSEFERAGLQVDQYLEFGAIVFVRALKQSKL